MSEDHLGIGWEASEGSVDMVQDVQFVTWRVENLTDWHIEPKCYVNFMNGTEFKQCEEALQVTLYKTPDSVSISSVDHTGPMVEGRQYQLQYPPSFSTPDEEVLEVIEGKGVRLNCHSLGNPTPVYSWLLPQSQEETHNHTLVTSSSLPAGSHRYTCRASNQLGEISKEFTVKIKHKGSPRTVLWSLIAVGVAVAVVLIAGYVYLKSKAGENTII
ncbi:hypothetical protein MATL_G00220140 [Megalops atlanticus]|uniref:Ig-like domain-containing protein n=1 Tax=Megalops atlanticus TaxID=7932 RepID=A0A9D3PHD0_MEGAT|nr:hypothetical protein MATL_G00220140 [Megalops atlanticus]